MTSSRKKWLNIISPALSYRSTGFNFFCWFYTPFSYFKSWEDIAVLILIVRFCARPCGIGFIEYSKAKYFNTIYFTDTHFWRGNFTMEHIQAFENETLYKTSQHNVSIFAWSSLQIDLFLTVETSFCKRKNNF